MAREAQGEADNAGGGKREAKRRMGEVMRGKLGPPRVTDVPQIFGIEVLFELSERDGREEESSIRERETNAGRESCSVDRSPAKRLSR